MNNLKKIGLTALAGSLVATSVQATDLTASGAASIGFGGADKGTSANGFYMNDSVTFSGSGEMDNGFNVTLSLELDNNENVGTSAMDSRSIKIDMADMGTLTFGGHGGDSVVGGVDDVMPTAYGETWDIISNTVDNGGVTTTASTLFGAIGSAGSNNMMRYDNTTAVDGLKISASYVPSGTGEVASSTDYGLEYTGYEGLTVGYAMGENNAGASTTHSDNETMYIKYAYGPVTVGYQSSEIDGQDANSSDEWDAYGITYAVSDDLSIGYGESTYNAGDLTTDQENSNISVSYTSGGMTLAAGFAEEKNRGGLTTAINDVKGYDIALSFAF
jgi:outer membrane protein OmpU